MSFNYTTTQASAKRLLERFGRSVSVRVVTPGAYDPATGTQATTTSDTVTTGVLLDYEARQIDGTLIQVGDKWVFIPGDVAVPDADAQVLINGVLHEVVRVNPLEPGGTVVLIELQIRK